MVMPTYHLSPRKVGAEREDRQTNMGDRGSAMGPNHHSNEGCGTHTNSGESHTLIEPCMSVYTSQTHSHSTHTQLHTDTHSTCLHVLNLKPIDPLPLLQAFVLRVAH